MAPRVQHTIRTLKGTTASNGDPLAVTYVIEDDPEYATFSITDRPFTKPDDEEWLAMDHVALQDVKKLLDQAVDAAAKCELLASANLLSTVRGHVAGYLSEIEGKLWPEKVSTP